MALAILSFTLPAGLQYSSFANSLAAKPYALCVAQFQQGRIAD